MPGVVEGLVIAVGTAVGSATAGAVIVYGGTALALGYTAYNTAMTKAKRAEQKARAQARNRAQEIQNMQFGTIAPRRFIYGQTVVNGHLVFQETAGTDNKNLYRMVYLGEGPIQSADKIFFNESEIPLSGDLDGTNGASVASGSYAGYAGFRVGLNGGAGASGTVVPIVNNTDWTADHKMTGNAFITYVLTHNNEVWTSGSVPQVRTRVNGRKIYDPRLDGTVSGGSGTHRYNDETTWAYSNNSALCVLDFLINGMKVDVDDIDLGSFQTAADTCDDNVTITDSSGSTTTEKRYTTNGVAFLDEEVISTLENLLIPCHGSLIEEGGTIRLLVPGGTTTVTANLDEDDFVSELNIKVNAQISTRINTVGGTFTSATEDYQEVDFNPISSSSLIADDGREHIQEVSMSMVTSEAHAQRLASIVLKENALTNSISVTLKPEFAYLRVGDIVTVTFQPEVTGGTGTDSILTTATKFQIISYNLQQNGEVSVELQEYADASYTWDTADHSYVVRTALADSFIDTIPAPTLGTPSQQNFLDETGAQVLAMRVPITHGSHPNFAYTQIKLVKTQFTSGNVTRTNGVNDFQNFYVGADAESVLFSGMSVIPPIGSPAGDYIRYKVLAQTVIENGKRSSVTEITNQTIHTGGYIQKDTTAPAAATTSSGTDAEGAFRSVKLKWTNPTDLDFLKVKIYRHTANSFADADLIGEAVGTTFTDTGLSDSATFHYWVTVLDRVGNESSQFYLGSATTDAAFPKGEKGETGTSVKGDKGEEGTSVKGEKGEAVKGEKGQEGEPTYPPFGKFAYYYSTSDTTPNQDARIYFGNSGSDPDNSPSDGTWPSTIYIRLDEDGKRLAGEGFSSIYLQTELDNAVRPAGSGMVVWENDDNWAYYRSSTNGGGANVSGGYHYMEGTRVSYKGSIDVVGQWYKIMVEAEPLSAVLVTLNGADLYMDAVDPRNNNTAVQAALDSAFLNANPLLTRMSQIPEDALVWARFIYRKSESFTTTTGQTTFTLTGGHTIDSQTLVNYDGDTLRSGDFASAQADASTGNSASIEITNQYLTRKGISEVPSGKTVVIDYIQASARTWTYSTQDWSDHAATFDSPQIFSPLVLSKEVLTQSLQANEITADQLVLNKDVQLLDGAAWRVGKTTYSDTTDGIFFGNPAGTGTGNHAFAFTATSNSGTASEHGLEITPDLTKLIQPTIVKTSQGALTSAQTPTTQISIHLQSTQSATTLKSSTLNPNAQSITINAIGGGGGGAGADGQTSSALAGGTTTYVLVITGGSTAGTYTVNASGGAAGSGYGADKWRGDAGSSSSYASGGSGGGSQNAVGTAGSLGSGGGGGAGRPPDWNQSSKKGGAGGGAATVVQNTYDISGATSVTLAISSIGSGGSGGSSTRGNGGAGGAGSVNYTIQSEGLEPVILNTESEYKEGTISRYQTWTQMSINSDRFANVNYQNTTDQPIVVNTQGAGSAEGALYVWNAQSSAPTGTTGGIVIGASTGKAGDFRCGATAIVPVGGWYRANSGTPQYWAELR